MRLPANIPCFGSERMTATAVLKRSSNGLVASAGRVAIPRNLTKFHSHVTVDINKIVYSSTIKLICYVWRLR